MKMNENMRDTIAAISSAVSESGIGIIRISGPDAVAAADIVFRSPGGTKKLSDAASHTIHYGYILDSEGGVIDEVLVSVMRAPRTYTAEDTVEINCHGGILAMKKVLDAVLHCDGYPGADNSIVVRAAEPGEYTKRAFINGRIDLSRAEAVMDLIQAKNEYALRNSVNQVRGSLFNRISELRSEILYEASHIEASLDDPENLDFSPQLPHFRDKLSEWRKSLAHLISSFEDGRLASEGIRTVIAGKPNAGKSSLLNLFLGEERAIVTDIAGTTRDLLTETINLQGITLLVTDTAGIRDTSDEVEKIGVQRAERAMADADLILWIIDSSVPLDENDIHIASLLSGRRGIILLNKSDLETVTGEDDVRALLNKSWSDYEDGSYSLHALINEDTGTENGEFHDTRIIPFSALDGSGYDEFIMILKDLFFHGKLSWNDEVVITSARHRSLLVKAAESLGRVNESLEAQMSEDFFAIDLMDAYGALGAIIGEEVGEDLIDEIFSRFCMGK